MRSPRKFGGDESLRAAMIGRFHVSVEELAWEGEDEQLTEGGAGFFAKTSLGILAPVLGVAVGEGACSGAAPVGHDARHVSCFH